MTLSSKTVLINVLLLAAVGCRGERGPETAAPDVLQPGATDGGGDGGIDAGDRGPLTGDRLTGWLKRAAGWQDLPSNAQVSTKCRLRVPVAYDGVALKLDWTACGDGCRELVSPDLIGAGWTGSVSPEGEGGDGEAAVLAISLYVEKRPPWETRLLIGLPSGEIKAAMHAISTGVEDPIGQYCSFGMSYSAPVLCAGGSETMTGEEGLSVDGAWSPGEYGWDLRLPASPEPYTGCRSYSTGTPGKLVIVCPGGLWLLPKEGSSEKSLLAKPGGAAAAGNETFLAWVHLVESGDQISSVIYTWRPGDNVFSQLALDGAVCAVDVTGNEVVWVRHTGPHGEGRGCDRGFTTTQIEAGAIDVDGKLHASSSSPDMLGVLYGVRRVVGSRDWAAALLPRTDDSGAYDREDWLVARRSQWEARTIRPQTTKLFVPEYVALKTGSVFLAEVGAASASDTGILKSLREYDLSKFEQIGEPYGPGAAGPGAAPKKVHKDLAGGARR